MRKIFYLLTPAIFLAMSPWPALAQSPPVYIDWVSVPSPVNATFNFGSKTGTVTVVNQTNWLGGLLGIASSTGLVNYPGTWYTPTPPPSLLWLDISARNMMLGTVGSAEVEIAFSSPVADPRIHFVNLDNATVDFSSTMRTCGGGPVSVSRLSGNDEFETTGPLINSTPATADLQGCEDLMGGNPNGGCGTVQLTGVYSKIVFTVTDTDVTASGDGFRMTLSKEENTKIFCDCFESGNTSAWSVTFP